MTARVDTPDSRPAVAIGHIVLRCADVRASARFYAKLGGRPVFDSADMAILELRGGTHLMLFAGEPGDRERPGFDLMVDDVAGWRERSISAGIECSALERHEPSGHELFTCADPDGHRIACYSSHTEGRAV